MCDRRIWHKIDMMKSGDDLKSGSSMDADNDEDESARWSWYISWESGTLFKHFKLFKYFIAHYL